ncbi:MAG: septal ring lytic transglycosylase RlpA family protein, partial [Spirochaetes bacterium]|nr:septal ring lytic transglycosylase RlpA family protein [Spirochaetota bacterium]
MAARGVLERGRIAGIRPVRGSVRGRGGDDPSVIRRILAVAAIRAAIGLAVVQAPGAQAAFETGIASWYGEPFHGRKTASGEVFDMRAMSAAHKSLPFGTLVLVTAVDDGRSVVVRINDRGPFVAGRIIDLSKAAAALIGLDRSGT